MRVYVSLNQVQSKKDWSSKILIFDVAMGWSKSFKLNHWIKENWENKAIYAALVDHLLFPSLYVRGFVRHPWT